MNATDRAVERVRQLLALAKSSNEHEAAAAAATAAKIMEAHRIDEAMIAAAEKREHQSDDGFSLGADNVAARAYKTTVRWYWGLAWGIATANRCMPHFLFVRARSSVGSRIQTKKRVAFAGKPSDAAACRYMLDAISNDVDRLADAFVEANRYGTFRSKSLRSIGNNFRLGCAARICQRLDTIANEAAAEKRRQLSGSTAALVRLDDALRLLDEQNDRLKEWLAEQQITYKNGRKPAAAVIADAFMAGFRAGETVRLQGGRAELDEGETA